MESMNIINYTDKSIVIYGGNTKKYKDGFKSLGGKWNSNLTHKDTKEKFGGWVFSKTKLEQVEKYINGDITVDTVKFKEKKNIETKIQKLEKDNEQLLLEISNLKVILQQMKDTIENLSDIVENLPK